MDTGQSRVSELSSREVEEPRAACVSRREEQRAREWFLQQSPLDGLEKDAGNAVCELHSVACRFQEPISLQALPQTSKD